MRLRLVLAGLLAALAAGCGSSRPAAVPLVVDTDLSSDDLVALLYLAHQPGVDLRAVTVSGTGLVHCPAGARNAAALLAVVGRTDVPVACGRDTPLSGFRSVSEDWRRAADEMFGLDLPRVPARGGDAVALLRRHAPGATVLELAPMTNLAAALRADPSLGTRVRSVVAMAGAFSVPGNAPSQEDAETNAWLDPAALRAVLGVGPPLTLVPLDATNAVPVTPYLAVVLQQHHYASVAATLAWEVVNGTAMASGGTYFWDPLAAAAVVDPGVLAAEQRRIAVDARGRTFASASGRLATVATGADSRRFERDLLGSLLGGESYAINRRPAAALIWDGTRCAWDGPRSLTAGRMVVEGRNTTLQPFQFVVAAIRAPHTLADLRAYVAGLTGPPQQPPPWLEAQTVGTVQPRSTMPWLVWAASPTAGSVVVACALTVPPWAAIAASVPVYASR